MTLSQLSGSRCAGTGKYGNGTECNDKGKATIMRIGIPREVKILEGRVALIPEAAAELIKHGHQVYMEKEAGLLSGYSDQLYQALGIEILPDAKSLYEQAEMIVKVKEPQPQELDYLRKDHLLFSYLHLAAATDLMKSLQEIGLTAVAFETVEKNRALPLLAPMSDIAGRLSIQIGTHLLHQPQGGRGILLGGLPGAERGKVVILGGGLAGSSAAIMLKRLAPKSRCLIPTEINWQPYEVWGITLPPCIRMNMLSNNMYWRQIYSLAQC